MNAITEIDKQIYSIKKEIKQLSYGHDSFDTWDALHYKNAIQDAKFNIKCLLREWDKYIEPFRLIYGEGFNYTDEKTMNFAKKIKSLNFSIEYYTESYKQTIRRNYLIGSLNEKYETRLRLKSLVEPEPVTYPTEGVQLRLFD